MRTVARLALSIPCLIGAYWAVRLAYADWLFRSGEREQLERAAQLVPTNPDYQARLGHLERAVALNPYLSSAWIELGLRAEEDGDWAKAEKALLEAARVDKTYEPRWALANYYLRRDEGEQFWKWIREAAAISYGDRTALFALCLRKNPDAEAVLDLAIPRTAPILSSYLKYVCERGEFPTARKAAALLLEAGGGAEHDKLLLSVCEQLIEKAADAEGAIYVWNELIARRLLPFSKLDPRAGASLTNGEFEVAPSGHGFDWRILYRAGLSSSWRPAPTGLRVSFDGREYERTDVLTQYLPLLAHSKYELSYKIEFEGILAAAGLRWQVRDIRTGVDLASPQAIEKGLITFVTPRNCDLAQLILTYQRAAGTSRAEGTVTLTDVVLRVR